MEELNEYFDEVQELIGYEFDEPELLFQAFTRRSYSQEKGGANNEVLEFVGDRVLDYYVTKILMDWDGYISNDGEFLTNKYKTEGKFTELKKKLVNKKMLAHRIDMMGFKYYLYMSNGDIKLNQQDEDSVKEDLFEAILGAIAIDSKWDSEALENSVKFMLNIEHYLNNGFSEENDYVALIQQWNQKENGNVPYYRFEELRDGCYRAYLHLNTKRGEMRYYEDGNSKSKARALVAETAYEDLDEHDELFTIMDELPYELTTDNSINTLQELAQKGYISMPEYDIPEDQVYDNYGNPRWSCTCYIRSEGFRKTAYANSKKEAKKYAAYLCICQICDLKNQYEEEE